MNERLNLLPIADAIRKLAPQLGGVFSSADLASIITGGSDLRNARTIKRLVKLGAIFRVQRGLYTSASCDLAILASRINPSAYLSMDSVLARQGLTGTIPERSLSMVQTTRARVVESVAGRIYFHSIANKLIFGIDRQPSGVLMANAEKAFLDLLYYHVKGVRFPIDPLADVNITKLNSALIRSYLQKYDNPKFVTFVQRILDEQ